MGFANTAADACAELVGTAQAVYICHRRGSLIFPRILNHKPIEQVANKRLNSIKFGLTALAPVYFTQKFEGIIEQVSDAAWKGRLKDEWGFRPIASPAFSRPIVSDTLIPLLEAGHVKSVPGIKRVLTDGRVELTDGRIIWADAIIFATGYEPQGKSHLCNVVDFDSGDDNIPLARLYQNIYHPRYSDSLAYMTFWHLPTGICEVADLLAMGIAQVFSGRHTLPPLDQMNAQIGAHQSFVRSLAKHAAKAVSVAAAEKLLDEGPWRYALHDFAGTQVNEKLGYALEGWKFWWQDREMSDMLMTGIDTPLAYRLFDGRPGTGRLKWTGARAAIMEANKELKEFEAKSRKKEEQSKKML